MPAPTSTLGLTTAEAVAARAAAGPPARVRTGRTYFQIVWSNTVTIFNLVLGTLLVLTLVFGDPRDALFGGVIVANTLIGIVQEIRAKRTLDRLELLVAPRARAWRDGAQAGLAVDELVVGDVIRIVPGDQIVADGTLVDARALSVDESVLTGEADPVTRERGEDVRSGSYCVVGSGDYRVEALGADSYAGRLAAEAKGTREQLSPLQQDINWVLRLTVAVMLPLGVLLTVVKLLSDLSSFTVVSEVVAALVPVVPEGLFLLTTLTFAAAAIELGRRGTLAQRLNATESLASVDTVCLDKTGTLTDNRLRVDELLLAEGTRHDEVAELVGVLAASAGMRNTTMEALHEGFPAAAGVVRAEVPFSSARKWSGVTLDGHGTVVLGAPEILAGAGVAVPDALARAVADHQAARLRVVLVAVGEAALDGESLPDGLRAMGAVALREGLRPEAVGAVGFLTDQGVEAKVISGDGLGTVQAVALEAGIPRAAHGVSGPDIPPEEPGLGDTAIESGVMARVTPEQKEHLIGALTARGRYVAMVGDGVNDVLALKRSRLAIAMGNGSQMAKGVADLVLLTDSFATVPVAVELGRRIIRNTHRVAKLFVTKSVSGATYLATIGLAPVAFPFLARQQTVIGSLSIGIPAFFLALAPSTGPVRRDGFLPSLLGFAVPAGLVIALTVMLGYLLVTGPMDEGVTAGRTVATVSATVLGLVVLLLVERGPEGRPIRAWVWFMTAVLLGILLIALLIPWLRDFFALTRPTAEAAVAIALCAIVGAAGLTSIRRIPALRRLESRGS